ncbi:MAG TPA: hypothetical protein VKZ70_12775, partial [Burkholderiaceae bacterium]|nr:hypothetical protein [Burkholderiaceae bacterium]
YSDLLAWHGAEELKRKIIMAYQFHLNGETYIGRTTPGAARMRIFHSATGKFVVAFQPNLNSLRGRRPWGSWANIQPGTDIQLLESLQGQILSACQQSQNVVG